MKLLLAVARYEVLLQLRSTRFRIAAIGYVVSCALPPCLLYFDIRHRSTEILGSASYLAQTLQVQPFLTVLMVALVAGNRSGAGALEESWAVLAASPMSNAGYLARRAVALLSLILPLSLVPQAVSLAVALAAGNESLEPTSWIAPWCLWILPLVISMTFYWLAWVTIAGSELAALIFSFVALPLVVAAANQALLDYHLTLSGYRGWLGFGSLTSWIFLTLYSWGKPPDNTYYPGYAATESPFDPAVAAAWWLPQGALITGLAVFGLGLATAFLRRTSRDLRPRPVPPGHQLRTFLEKLNRWRGRYAPDGGLGRAERLTAAAGVVFLGLALTWLLDRQRHFLGLAAERYRAEMECDFEPLPADLRLTSWRLRGRIDRHGGVEIDAAGHFENHGSSDQDALVFTLNPGLEIEHLEVPARRVEVMRAWDRLRLRLDPALAAGEHLDLELRLAGTPTTVVFGLGRDPFARGYERSLRVRFPREVSDLSRSRVHRAVSPRRVRLRASDLGPLPRYSPWTLTRPGESEQEDPEYEDLGREVPDEAAPIVVDLELDLEAPGEWFLADTCGHTSRRAEDLGITDRPVGRSRLSGTCRTSLTELMVAGGRLARVDSEDLAPREGFSPGGEVIIAALPAHRARVENQLESLALVASLSDRAWPGMPGLHGLVALEWPPEPHDDLRHHMVANWWWQPRPELVGRLLLIPECLLVDTEPLEPEDLVAQLLGRDLLARRELAAEQKVLFRHLFQALMIRRMGLDDGRGATVEGKPWARQALRAPILLAKPGFSYTWEHRLPAVLAEIEGRVGGDNLYAAIDSFLAAGGDRPGTIEDLLAAVEARAGISLERTYQDHFLGSALPMLRLEDVGSRRGGNGWVVEGKVRNTGTGQSICPLIVKTEISERKLIVTVDSESATSFTTSVATRPHTVLLDPERTCYRWLLKTSPILERANLLTTSPAGK